MLSVQQRFNETLDEDLVQPHRQHIREGVFRKKHEDDDMDWSDSLDDSETAQDDEEKGKMYCFLFNDMFLVAECVGKDRNKKFSLDGNFDLATTFVKDDAEPDCLQVVNPRSTYVFRCSTKTEKELWHTTISQAIEALLKINKAAVDRRGTVEVKFDADNGEWSAEINNSTIFCNRLDDNSQYREMVLENTQRELARFMDDNSDRLAKIRFTPSKSKTPSSKSKNVFKRIQESFITPQKTKEKLERERKEESQRLADMMAGQNNSTRKRSATVVGFGDEPHPVGVPVRSTSMMDLAAQFAAAQTPIKQFEDAGEVFAPGSPQIEFLTDLTQKDNPNDGVSVISKQLSFVQRQLSNIRTPAKTPGTDKKKRRRERKLEESAEASSETPSKKTKENTDGKENVKENKHKRSHTSTDSFDLTDSSDKGGSVREKGKSSKRRQSLLLPKNSSISADVLSQNAHSSPSLAGSAATIFAAVDSPSKLVSSPSRRAARMSLDPSAIQRLGITSPSKIAMLCDSPSKLRF